MPGGSANSSAAPPMPLVYDRDGLPMEAAACEGYGVPLARAQYEVLLDGVPVDHAVAFSRPEGWVVRQVRDTRGRPVLQGDRIGTERLTGHVAVRRLAVRG